MKNLVYGETSWLVGDDAADAVLAYAVLMAQGSTADSVELTVLGPDGREETTSLVLGPATMIQAHTMQTRLAEPENAALVEYVNSRVTRSQLPAQPVDQVGVVGGAYDEIV